MTEAPKEIMVSRIAEAKSTCWWVVARNRAAARYRIPVSDCLGVGRAAKRARPVNSIRLHRISSHFYKTRLDHHLLGRLVDCHEQFADIVDVAAGLAEENGVGALVHLRRIFARELRSKQRSDIFGSRITKLIAVAFGRLSRALRCRLYVIDIVDLIHEEAFRFHDDRDRLQCAYI